MARIDDIFARLRSQGRKALCPFICGGHGGAGVTASLIPALESAGASIIEVGIPFSDPIADGPVIAAAMHKAIQPVSEGGGGATPLSVLDEVASVRAKVGVGLVAMVSASIVHRMGGAMGFAKHAKEAGLDGLIIPDLTIDEADEALAAAVQHDLSFSLLIAPTTTGARLERIARACRGFIYLLARAGITGERAEVPDISPIVAAIRRAASTPIACGFGISTAEHVRTITGNPMKGGGGGGGADAAIVGSALVRTIDAALEKDHDPVEAARVKVAELAKGLA